MDRARRRVLWSVAIGVVGLGGCLDAERPPDVSSAIGAGATDADDEATDGDGLTINGSDADGTGANGSDLDSDDNEREPERGNDTDDDGEPEREPDDTEPEDEDKDEGEDRADTSPPENGVVAFVYHDGPIQDYTQAYPAHEAFDVPATVCPVTRWIGREYGAAERLGTDHLAELHDAGWEIASHTADHATLGAFELVRDAEPSATKIYPESYRHGHHDGYEVAITDGEETITRTVAGYGSDRDGQMYVELEEPLERTCTRESAVVRWPEERMHDTLASSKRALTELGYDVDTLLAPYDKFGEYAMEFVPEYYDFVANASSAKPRINDPGSYDPYETRHRYFIEYTDRTAVQADLDRIASKGAFGVFGAHTFDEKVTEDRIRETLEWIDERDIEVMTFREAATLYADHNP